MKTTEFYGACGVKNCRECLPRYDLNDVPTATPPEDEPQLWQGYIEFKHCLGVHVHGPHNWGRYEGRARCPGTAASPAPVPAVCPHGSEKAHEAIPCNVHGKVEWELERGPDCMYAKCPECPVAMDIGWAVSRYTTCSGPVSLPEPEKVNE